MERPGDVKMNSIRRVDPEVVISWTLRIGVYLASGVVVLGLVLDFLMGSAVSKPGAFPTTVAEVWAGLSRGNPVAVISLGLLLLIVTPVFRVAASVLLFLLEQDYLYTLITLLVLVILLSSFFLGKAL